MGSGGIEDFGVWEHGEAKLTAGAMMMIGVVLIVKPAFIGVVLSRGVKQA